MWLILERVCEHDEKVNVHGSVKYREIHDQLKYCWVGKHGFFFHGISYFKGTNMKLHTLLAFAVSPSPFINTLRTGDADLRF
jgi:hypothetical protein